MDPIQQLYDWMRNAGHLSEAVPFENFSAKMQDSASQRALYDRLAAIKTEGSQYGAAGGDWSAFESAYFKKKVDTGQRADFSSGPGSLLGASPISQDASSQGSETPSLSANAPAPTANTPSAPDVFAQRLEEDTSAQPPATPDISAEAFLPKAQEPVTFDLNAPGAIPDRPRDTGASPYILTGQEDINTHIDQLNKTLPGYEYRKEYEGKTVLRQANRDMRNIAEYGTLARKQAEGALESLVARYGQDWQQNQQVAQDPEYKRYAAGVEAQNKAFEEYAAYAEKHPEFAGKMAMAQSRQEKANRDYSGPYGAGLEIANIGGHSFRTPSWMLSDTHVRKAASLLGGLLSLPRTVSGGLPDDWVDTQKFGVADKMASWGDELVEEANLRYPKPQQLQRPLWENTTKFEGKEISVGDGGKINEVRDKDGNKVEVTPEFETRFKESGKADKASFRFNGATIADQALNATADLMLYRYLGRGTKMGTMLSSFGMSHQQAYQEAIVQNKMSPQDAAEFAFYSALGTGMLEAYVGNIETALAKPGVSKALEIGKKEALALAGKSSPAQMAMTRLKPVLKEVGGENAEEILQSVYGDMVRYGYNKMTGADMEMQTTPKSLAETALITTLITAPAAGIGGHSNSYRQSALMAAVNDPTRFEKVMGELVDSGAIDGQQALALESRVNRLSTMNGNLPVTMSDEQRGQVIALQEYRDIQDQVASSENYTEAQRKNAKEEVKKVDAIIGALVDNVDAQKVEEAPQYAPPQVAPDFVPASQEAAVAEKTTTEPTVKENLTVPLPVVNAVPSDAVSTRADLSQVEITPENERLVSGEFFSDPDMTVGKLAAAVQIPSEDPAGDQTDAAATTQTAVGDRITEGAVDMLQRKGYPSPDAKEVAAIQTFVLPYMIRPAIIEDVDEHPARVLDRITDEYMIEKGVEPKAAAATVQERAQITQTEEVVSAIEQTMPQDQQSAIDAFAVQLGNDPARIAAAIDGSGTPEDIQIYKTFAAGNPDAASQIKNLQDEVKRNVVGSPVEAGAITEPITEQTPQTPDAINSAGLAGAQTSEPGRGTTQADVPGRTGTVAAGNKVSLETTYGSSGTTEGIVKMMKDFFYSDNITMEKKPGDDYYTVSNSKGEIPGIVVVEQKGRFKFGKPGEVINAKPVTVEQASETQEDVGEALKVEDVPERTTTQVVTDMTTEGIADADQAAIASLVDEGVYIPGGEAVQLELFGKSEQLREDNSPEKADVIEAQQYEDAKEAGKPATVLDRPVFVETATEFIVTRSTDIRDVMREMGGKWQPGRGWVFPIGMKMRVMQAIQRPANPTSEALPKHSGLMNSRLAVSLRNKLIYRTASQRMRRIEKAATLEDQLNIAKEELNIAQDERKRRVMQVAERIQQAFPGVEVVTDPKAFAEAAKVFGDTPPVAFTVDGKVYIDMERADIDAPLHEFGHIWNTLSAVHFPEQHKRGLESVRGSEYEAAVREDERYAHLDDAGVLDEALALAIGERGARLMNASKWSQFRDYLTDMFRSMRTLLGIDAPNMSASQYADWVAAKMLDGKVLFSESADEIKRIEKQALAMFLGLSSDWKAEAKKAFVTAKTMEYKGFSNHDVWQMTNWRRGIDGRWKFEISDARAQLVIEPRLMESGDMLPLSSVMKHSGLYSLLPEMQDIPVQFYYNSATEEVASTRLFDDGSLGIAINTAFPDDVTLSLLHEAQHIVQLYEGFALGLSAGNASEYLKANIDDANAAGDSGRVSSLIDALNRRHEEIYARAAGEVEARNVETRADMSAEEIREVAPMSTEDVAPEEQIVLFNKEVTDLIDSQTLAPPGFEQEGEDFKGFDGPARFMYGNQQLRADAVKNAVRQIVRIQIGRGTEDSATAIPKIAEELGVSDAFVAQVWDEESAKPHKFDMRDGGGQKSFADKVGRWAKSQFSYKGLLPKDIHKEAMALQNRVSAIMYRGAKQVRDLEKAMNAATSNMSEPETRAFRRHVNDVLNGRADWGSLPPEVEAQMMIVRGTINDLSQEILRSGVYGKDIAVTILENMGVDTKGANETFFNEALAALEKPPYERSADEIRVIDEFISSHHTQFGTYLNRSYRVHNYPDWKERIPRDVWDNARRFFIRELQKRHQELQEIVSRNDEKEQEKLDKLNDTKGQTLSLIDEFIQDLDAADPLAPYAVFAHAELSGISGLSGMTPEQIKEMDVLIGEDADALRGWFQEARDLQEKIVKQEEKMAARKDKAAEEMDDINGRLLNIDDEIHEALDRQTAPEALLGGAIVGAKPLGVMKKRDDIPEEIRMLFGEYRDPTVNVMQSMFKMANLISSQTFLNNLRSRYEGTYFFKGGNKPAGNWAKVSAEGNNRLAPLDGWYTTEDIRDGLRDFYNKSEMAWWQKFWISHVVNYIKVGKTILSPVTQARNFWGNASFALANGWNPLRMFQAWNEYGAMWNGMDSSKWRKYAERLHELGVFGESANARDIEDLRDTLGMKDIPNEQYEEFVQNRFLQTAAWPVKMAVKGSDKAFEIAQKAYEMGDSFWKMMGFENEKRRYAQAYFGKSFDQLTKEQQAEVEARAAHIVRSVLPTYSFVPKIVQSIRRFPFTGTFVAFPAEMIRVTYNSYALGLEEMKDPRTRVFGALRLAGISTSLSMSALTVFAAKNLFGYSDEEWDDANFFVSEFQKNAMLVPMPRDDKGNLRYINLSYTDPYSFVGKTLNAGFDDPTKPPAGRAASMLAQLVEPFVAPELTFNTIEQLRLNVDDWGNPIRQDAYKDKAFGTAWLAQENVARQLSFAAKKLQPGFVKSGWDAWDIHHVNVDKAGRIKNWDDFALNHLTGLKVETIDPAVSYEYQMKALIGQRNMARGGYTSVQKRLNKSWEGLQESTKDMSAEDKAVAIARFEDNAREMLKNQYDVSRAAYIRVLEDAHVTTMALIRLQERSIGKENAYDVARGVLKDVKFGTRTGEIDAIISGNYSDLILAFKKKGKY